MTLRNYNNPDGLKCSRCEHTGHRVTDTRQMRGTVRRFRRCRSCGHVFTTVELRADPQDRPDPAHVEELTK